MKSINRDLIIEKIYGGQAVKANGPIMPGTWAYYDDLEVIDYDVLQAKTLFDANGVTADSEAGGNVSSDGLDIAVDLLYPDTAAHAQMG